MTKIPATVLTRYRLAAESVRRYAHTRSELRRVYGSERAAWELDSPAFEDQRERAQAGRATVRAILDAARSMGISAADVRRAAAG